MGYQNWDGWQLEANWLEHKLIYTGYGSYQSSKLITFYNLATLTRTNIDTQSLNSEHTLYTYIWHN